jgi:MFS family permease
MGAATEQMRESRDSMVEVFRNPSLRKLNLALAGSVIGDWAFGTAIAVFAFRRGGAGTVGALLAIRYVVAAVVGPFLSVLADKLDRRRVMVGADVIRFALVAAATIVVFSDGPALPVYALYLCTAIVGLAFRPAQASLLPSLVNSPRELTAANVASLTIHSVGFFAGPAIAGLLLALTDIGWVFAFDALTFLWSAVLVAGIHTEPRAPTDDAGDEGSEGVGDDAQDEKGAFLEGLGDGYRAIFASRDLRLITGLYIAQTVVAGAGNVYEVAIALDLLHLGNGGVGLLGMALGVGGVIGGAVALLLAQRGKMARDFGLGITLWAAPLLLVAAWPSVASALVAMALIGLGNSVVDVNAETIVQRLVPDVVLGRVFGALDSAATAGMAVGAVLMPLLIRWVGLRSGLLLLAVTVTTVVLLCVRGLVRIDRTVLVPDGLDLLRGVPMLAVLPERLLERLARSADVVRVAAGTTVFHEGDAGDRFFIIEQGNAAVAIGGAVVNTIGPGASFGEIALLRDVPRTATISADTDLTMRAIDRRHFLPAVTGHADAREQAEMVVGRWTRES